jgi:hypothetical protein
MFNRTENQAGRTGRERFCKITTKAPTANTPHRGSGVGTKLKLPWTAISDSPLL